ncbi:MAG: glycosyltransferase [Pleurocapsa sp. MO_226.B13]|nr:glycosyltransferase [Pleurocapsa sp. MO_226.B13]
MKHFGILCPPGAGHLNNFMALGYELQKRGHRVTLFGLPDVEAYAVAAKINFYPLASDRFPVGSTERSNTRLGKLDGITALLYTIDLFRQGTEVILEEVPQACQQTNIEVLLIDQVLLEGSSIAEYLRLPFITICSALLLNPEPTVPPTLTGWGYDPSWLGQLRNQIGNNLLELAGTPIRLLVNQYRQKWGLDILKVSNNKLNLWSKKAIISQQIASFEFPRQELPDYFHFVGSLVNNIARAEIPFPWEQLTAKPLVYASLGTLQNKLLWVFIRIAYACLGLDVQLVISLGGATEPEELGYVPGSPIVVKAAPQLSILKRASLCITHAGLNTTLESLSNGVPMVAIPITNDQPAVAARVAWTKTGEVIDLNNCTVDTLRTAIERVLFQPEYRQNAMKLQAEIEQAGGATKAADIIENTIE